MRRAWSFGVGDRDIVVVAAAGFMLRGGIVLLAIPGLVLPSVMGLAAAAGIGFFAIDGRPTQLLFEAVAAGSLLSAAWLVVALVLGSQIDMWLIETAITDDDAVREPHSVSDPTDLLSLAGVRTVCLLIPVAAIAWAGPQVYSAVYDEFLTPSEIATPLFLRIVLHAAIPVAIVIVAWLLGEVIGAIAVRRLVFTGCGVWHALAGSLVQVATRPLTSIGTVVLSYGASAMALGGAIGITTLAFDWCLVAARNPVPIGPGSLDLRSAIFLVVSVVFSAAWLVSVAIAGAASAGRSAAFTYETADACGRNQDAPE